MRRSNPPELVVGEGLAAEDFGTIVRGDGSEQLTFHGRPLYHYSADDEPGHTRGHGIGDRWFVVDDEGDPIPN